MSALRSLATHYDVTWIASAMTAEERTIARAGPIVIEASAGNPLRLRFVEHPHEEYHLFYEVVANPALWFVQHGLWGLLEDPAADLLAPWRLGYRAVNERFAGAVLDELGQSPDTAVLFQDYHLYVAPRLVRTEASAACIAHFVHIPWVGADLWAALPPEIAHDVHDGLLAADSIGFHAARWRDAFVSSCEEILGRGNDAQARSHVNPIAIDAVALEAVAQSPAVAEAERRLARRPERLIVRVDRTDPSKNAVRGFAAFGRLLEQQPDLAGRVRMLALLDPSRQGIPEYAAYRAALERAAGAVNLAHGTADWQPVEVLVRDDLPGAVAALKSYDVLLVNPVLDGLNLVAKEGPFVNTRHGVLVLSRTAGAFEELGDWVIGIDPIDVDGTAIALRRALELQQSQREEWMSAIQTYVREHTLGEWAATELAELEVRSTMRA